MTTTSETLINKPFHAGKAFQDLTVALIADILEMREITLAAFGGEEQHREIAVGVGRELRKISKAWDAMTENYGAEYASNAARNAYATIIKTHAHYATTVAYSRAFRTGS